MENDKPDQAYRVLARKYRPENFSGLIGQDHMIRTLTNAFEAGRIAQAWMLTGVRGVGKTTTARILARALNYKTATVDQPSIDLTIKGEHCQAIMEGRHVDVIEMDAASHTGIDDIREIIEQVRYRPVSARYKVYIIDEVHMLSTQAFNGLLKTLEEPPPHVKFIFATTEIRKVPVTVLSRCQRFDLRRVETATMAEHLRSIIDQEQIEAQDTALAMIARAGEGSVRDALSILDQAIAHGAGKVDCDAVRNMLGLADQAKIIDLFELVMQGEIAKALDLLRQQYAWGADPLVILTELADFNHLVTRLRFTPELAQDMALSEDERVRGLQFSKALPISVLSRNWQMLLKGIQETQTASRPLANVEMVLIRLAFAADLPPIAEIVAKLQSEPAQDNQDASTQKKTENFAQQPIKPTGEASKTSPSASEPSIETQVVEKPTAQQKHADTMSLQPSRDQDAIATNNDTAREAIRNVFDQQAENIAVPAPIAEAEAKPEIQVDNVTAKAAPSHIKLDSFDDLIALCDTKRDPAFKYQLRNLVRLVDFAPLHMTVELVPQAPRGLETEIIQKLYQLTKQRWKIDVVHNSGALTISEQEQARQAQLVGDAQADPDVATILQQFPGAQIVDVRLNIEQQEDALTANDILALEHEVLNDSENFIDNQDD